MPETMTAGELLVAYEQYRTQHMTTVKHPADPTTGAPAWDEDVLVLDAEVQHEGTWRKVQQIGTDANDAAQPVYLDLDEVGRVVLTMGDKLTVRGLTEADPWAGPSKG